MKEYIKIACFVLFEKEKYLKSEILKLDLLT